MKIYQPGTHGVRTAFVQPGREYPSSQFVDDNGDPRMFSVKFIEGQAVVDDELGQYMIDQGLAKASPIILFSEAA